MNDNYCTSSKDGVNIGVDLNRNYGFHWGHAEPDDENECSEIFKVF